MVVYRKEPAKWETTEEASEIPARGPTALLASRPNSHPFQERQLCLEQAVKVGRSVARCRPAAVNAIFDCKVLSRNHALLWYDNGKFYLQDTKSSNGTFVNNQRLSKSSEESLPREVCSGDIVQFGVDVVENSRKVVHGCIVATLKLYLPDGKEAKASLTTAVVSLSPEASITSQELYQLSQYLQEALHREQILENKLGTLKKVVVNTQDESDVGWKALIEEDRLLTRIETLESQLQTCGKSITEEKLKDDVMKLQEDKDKYQIAAKDSLKKILQEKLEAIHKVQDLENSLSNTESECTHLLELNEKKEQEIQLLLEKVAESEKEISNITTKLQEMEEKYLELINQSTEEKLSVENSTEEMHKGEHILSTEIETLKTENDFAKEQLSVMKAYFDVLEKDHNLDDNVEKNGNLSAHGRVKRLESELQRVQKENLKNESHNRPEDCTSNGELRPADLNDLQDEMQRLQKLLEDSRETKTVLETELIQAKYQLEEVRAHEQTQAKLLLPAAMELVSARKQLAEERNVARKFEGKTVSLLETVASETDASKQRELIEVFLDELRKSVELSSLNDVESLETTEECSVPSRKYENLKRDCAFYQERIRALEMDITRQLVESVKSPQSSPCSTFGEQSSTEELDGVAFKLGAAREEIVLLKERFEECNREKSHFQAELSQLTEQLRLLTVHSRTVSVCSVVPLAILVVAVLLAFYPTLSYLTATTEPPTP